MKFKSYLLAAALLLGGAGAAAVGTSVTLAADEPTKVEAADSIPQFNAEAGDQYKIVGMLANYPDNSNWSIPNGLPFTVTEDGNYTIEIHLAVNDEFKIVCDYKNLPVEQDTWKYGVAYGDNWHVVDGGNMVVTRSGTYTITIPSNFNEYNDVAYGFTATTVSYDDVATVSLIGPDGSTVKTEERPIGTPYNVAYVLVDGYLNQGWFLDEGLTQPYETANLTGDLTLYGKWVEAGADTVVYFEGSFTYAYYWDEHGNTDKPWPGIELSTSEQVTVSDRHYSTDSTVYKIVVPAEVQAKNIKFSYGSGPEESNNFALVDGSVYNDAGIHEDKTNAMIFLAAFDELRDDNGDICGILEDSAKYEEVKGLYNTIHDKTLVDSLEDRGATIKVDDEYQPVTVTIGDTMRYLLVTRGTDVGAGAGLIGSFQKNASDWIAIVSIAAVSAAAAGLFFFIRKKKSAK